MNGKIRKYLPLLGIVAVLVLWGLWYGRPVGIETLFPGFDPDSVEVIASDYNVSPTESYSRGTPAPTGGFVRPLRLPGQRSERGKSRWSHAVFARYPQSSARGAGFGGLMGTPPVLR